MILLQYRLGVIFLCDIILKGDDSAELQREILFHSTEKKWIESLCGPVTSCKQSCYKFYEPCKLVIIPESHKSNSTSNYG